MIVALKLIDHIQYKKMVGAVLWSVQPILGSFDVVYVLGIVIEQV